MAFEETHQNGGKRPLKGLTQAARRAGEHACCATVADDNVKVVRLSLSDVPEESENRLRAGNNHWADFGRIRSRFDVKRRIEARIGT